jgi:hypothetical protein
MIIRIAYVAATRVVLSRYVSLYEKKITNKKRYADVLITSYFAININCIEPTDAIPARPNDE